MDFSFTNHEIAFLLFVTLFVIAIISALRYHSYLIYKERKLLYPLYAVRDNMIMCVATGAIKKNDSLFKLFYGMSNDMINSIHTDFFSMRSFYNSYKKYNIDEVEKFKKELLSEIKKRPNQFQTSIIDMFSAMEEIFIEKNLLLKFLIKYNFLKYNFFIVKIFKKLVLTINLNKNKLVIKQKKYLDEYRRLGEIKTGIATTVAV